MNLQLAGLGADRIYTTLRVRFITAEEFLIERINPRSNASGVEVAGVKTKVFAFIFNQSIDISRYLQLIFMQSNNLTLL